MASAQNSASPLSLAGTWRVALDHEDAGIAARWFASTLPAARPANLPGSLAAQRIGDDVTADTKWTATIFDRTFLESPGTARYREAGGVKMPFWLQPEKVFVGAAWYQRDIELPAAWRGRRVVLTLERPHWTTRVWLHECEIGAGDSLSVPHAFDLGCAIEPGIHRLTLRVDNRLHVGIGENAHSVSDHTQGNWNGVIGRIELAATAPAWINAVRVTPHLATRTITVTGTVCAATGHAMPRSIALAVDALGVTASAPIASDGSFVTALALGAAVKTWDEFSPAVYHLRLTPEGGESRVVAFGLREIATRGTQFLLNDRPLFLRGTLDCCVFPHTGHPPTDVEPWRKILRTIRAHGLNHVRFHSWCPPEAAFVAGDELGIYFQVEAGTWANTMLAPDPKGSASLGDGDAVDAWTFAESERIVRTYGNHPCFVLMAAGNEPGGPRHTGYLSRWVAHLRAFDPRRLYVATAGWPELPENQFQVIPEPRLHQWGDGLKSRLNAQPPAATADHRASVARRTVPVVAHEIGQWCAYPPLHDTAKFSGHLKARGYEIFADSLAARRLAPQLPDFVRASGKLQALCYKEEIETALRTPGFGGFQLLGLQDFPGQGTAPVGVLDAFWESKGYCNAEKFRRFCGPTIPLARLARRVFTTDDTLEAAIEVAHYGAQPLRAAASWWLLNERGTIVATGQLARSELEVGAVTLLGKLAIPLRGVPAPARYQLVVALDGTPIENDWDVWVYPALSPAEDAGVLVTASLADAEAALAAGRAVLLTLPPARVRGDVALGFTPIFWNTWCTQRQAPHTLGLLCQPRHAALADFPTEAHSDWQWWHLVTQAGAMVLDDLPSTLRPIVQVIDDWFTNRRLGLVFEARVGAGRLLVCSIDLESGLTANPVARQLRSSLVRYARSATFAPAHEVSFASVRALATS